MSRCVFQLSLLLGLLAFAACNGPSTDGSPSSVSTPTVPPSPVGTVPPPTPTPFLPAGFVLYSSADHTYQIAHPAGWQVASIAGSTATVSFTGPGQIFEVSEVGHNPGGSPADVVNAFCQERQPGVAVSPAKTSTVNLGGQSWTRANCDAGVQGPAIELVVEVVFYQGTAYQMDYTSPVVEFARDNKAFYAAMEQSFRFLK